MKYDMKSSFYLLPMHLVEFELLDFSCEGQLYIDRASPMGCPLSCAVFECFSSF